MATDKKRGNKKNGAGPGLKKPTGTRTAGTRKKTKKT